MEDFKPVRVEPADPTRCQAVGANGDQCPFQGMVDPTLHPMETPSFLKYCRMHGSATAKTMKKHAKRTYLLSRWKAQHDRLIDPEIGVNLDEELAVLRMVLQLALEKYEEVELITCAPQIQSMIRDIRDVLVANKKLKSQMGELLDRAAMHNLCDQFVTVIGKHVPPEKMDLVSQEIAEAIGKAVSNRMDGVQ